MDFAFLAVSGFVLGAFLYTYYWTTLYEPHVRLGYSITGSGLVVIVAMTAGIDITHPDIAAWWRVSTLLSYLAIAIGLALITRERRKRG